MSCNMVTSSSCYLRHLLNWWFLATMTKVKEKDRVSSLIATPPSEMCLSVAPWPSQEGLASPRRYLQHIADLTQKPETAPESLAPREDYLKGKLTPCRVRPRAWSGLSWAVPFPHPVLQRAPRSSVPTGRPPTESSRMYSFVPARLNSFSGARKGQRTKASLSQTQFSPFSGRQAPYAACISMAAFLSVK